MVPFTTYGVEDRRREAMRQRMEGVAGMSIMICQQCDRWVDTDFHEMAKGGEVCIPCDEDKPRFAPRDPENLDPMGAQNHPLPPFKGK